MLVEEEEGGRRLALFLSLKGDKERLSGGPGSGCGGAAVVVVERRRRALASDFLISWSLLLLCFCAGFRSKEGGGGTLTVRLEKYDTLCTWTSSASGELLLLFRSERASALADRLPFWGALRENTGKGRRLFCFFSGIRGPPASFVTLFAAVGAELCKEAFLFVVT